jgi:hypothetical protein
MTLFALVVARMAGAVESGIDHSCVWIKLNSGRAGIAGWFSSSSYFALDMDLLGGEEMIVRGGCYQRMTWF